jgi:hypothetical protein
MREANRDAIRGVLVAHTRGQISRVETERALRLAGWQEASIKRLLDACAVNLKIKGETHE